MCFFRRRPCLHLHLVTDRDSVAAGDDDDSHRTERNIAPQSSLNEVLVWDRRARYLPPIWGDRATWSVIVNGSIVAVVAQQWDEPRYLVDAMTPMERLADATLTVTIHYRYHCQIDPDLVFERLQTGQPLPQSYS